MNLAEAIVARRSVRSYLPEPVDESTLRSLLEAAVHAPSAMNAQPWLFAVVQDAERLRRYSDGAKRRLLSARKDDPELARYAPMLRDESFNIFYNAGTLVVIGSAAHGPFTDADCWLAAENLMLQACALGLGSCCIGFALDELNTPEVKAELGLPPNGVVVAAIVVGHPAQIPPPRVRTAPKISAWIHPESGHERKGTESFAREHPAGYLATRAAAPVTERVGHPTVHDEPGFGPYGQRQLPEGEREFTLSTSLPEGVIKHRR